MRHWEVYAIADDPYCSARITFWADTAEIKGETLFINGLSLNTSESWSMLREMA